MLLDVVRLRWLSAFVATVIVGAFVGGIIYKRQLRDSAFIYSVDFTGGTQVTLQFSKPVNSTQIDEILRDDYPGLATREFSDKEILLTVSAHSSDEAGVSGHVKQKLEQELSGVSVTIRQADSVGADVGESLQYQAIQAVLIILALMLLYIGSRFWGFSYAAASVVSLVHDVIVMLTFILWFDYEISMHIISAILFILGYSINDTIVIFARIRENIYKHKKETLPHIVNLSVNQTLRRTILTSIATCLVVVALLLFGGQALRTLSLALLIGMVFGTYSSIFVASPVMLAFHRLLARSR